MIYDISRTISSDTAVWPGDASYSVAHNLRLEDGASVNLTTMRLSPHTATHADAYYHYAPGGAHPAQMALDAYIGVARVWTTDKQSGPLLPSDFVGLDMAGVPRLLIHSYVSELADTAWPDEFPYLSVELIDWLAGQGVVLVGLDSPSVDAFDSTELPCHHAIWRAGMVNLELLSLRDVPDGVYELTALPLKLDQVCGSPVRAILRTLSDEES